MKKIGVGVIGCGSMAQGMHLPNVLKHPLTELLWCCDINDNTLKVVKDKFSPKRITKDAKDVADDPNCEMVIIATTHKERLSLIRLFSKSGKHIYVEKPLADNFEEMYEIAKQVKDTGIKFCIGHNRRMAPAVQEARRLYEKHKDNPVPATWRWDRIGSDRRPSFPQEEQTMLLMRINDDYWSWKEWIYKEKEGVLVGEMTHFVDLACYFIESPPVRITAIGSKLANHVINLEFKDGSISTIFGAAVGSLGYPKELIEIYHKGAAIIIDHLLEMRISGITGEPFRRLFAISNGKEVCITDYYEMMLASQKEAMTYNDNSLASHGPDKGHYRLFDKFIKEIQGGEKNPCNIEEAIKSTAVILKAKEALEKGCSQKISISDFTL